VALTVVAPVPWFPSTHPRFGQYAAHARVPREEIRDGITVLHPRYPVIPKIGMQLAPWLLARWTLGAVKRLEAEHGPFDVIDAHYLYPDGVAAAYIAQVLGKPLLITARGSDVNLIAEYTGPRRRILTAADTASAVITVSEALRRRLLDLGADPARVHTLRNGVNPVDFQPPVDRDASRARHGMRRRTLLSVGNLVRAKGHHLVIESLNDLPDHDLMIAGEGPERAALQALVTERKLHERVRFTGRVAQRELVELYGAADVLVLASSREGWPNVLLESMACGTPVAATAVGGIPELITTPAAGRLLEARTVAAIASACRALADAPPAREATRAHAQRFSWAPTVDGLWNLMQRGTSESVPRQAELRTEHLGGRL
jgi:glycosyltransferase involved in cell wall biosynthesis